MAALTLFPLQYQRQDSVPIDVDQVFATTAARTAYLTSPRRYAGQVVVDTQDSTAYFLNAARNAWIPISGPVRYDASTDSIVYTSTVSGGDLGVAEPKIINTSSNYVASLTDSGAMIRMTSASPLTFTIMNDATVSFRLGTTFIVSRSGTGSVTLVAGSGVTINSPNTLAIAKQHGKVTITRVAANTWDTEGNLT